jgi:phosphatidylserine synthase
LISAILGVSSFVASSSGYSVSHYQGVLLRAVVALVGCGFLYLARMVYKRQMVAWHLIFFGQPIAWIGFVVMGTHLTDSQYSQVSMRDNLLFGAMLAVVSLPVFIYWMLRWRKQRPYFDVA